MESVTLNRIGFQSPWTESAVFATILITDLSANLTAACGRLRLNVKKSVNPDRMWGYKTGFLFQSTSKDPPNFQDKVVDVADWSIPKGGRVSLGTLHKDLVSAYMGGFCTNKLIAITAADRLKKAQDEKQRSQRVSMSSSPGIASFIFSL